MHAMSALGASQISGRLNCRSQSTRSGACLRRASSLRSPLPPFRTLVQPSQRLFFVGVEANPFRRANRGPLACMSGVQGLVGLWQLCGQRELTADGPCATCFVYCRVFNNLWRAWRTPGASCVRGRKPWPAVKQSDRACCAIQRTDGQHLWISPDRSFAAGDTPRSPASVTLPLSELAVCQARSVRYGASTASLTLGPSAGGKFRQAAQGDQQPQYDAAGSDEDDQGQDFDDLDGACAAVVDARRRLLRWSYLVTAAAGAHHQAPGAVTRPPGAIAPSAVSCRRGAPLPMISSAQQAGASAVYSHATRPASTKE